MISSISSMSSSISSMFSSATSRQQPPPPDQDVFQLSDTDSDGLLSTTELETLTQGIAETTGTQIDMDEVLANFDTDQDGSLSGEETKGLMDSYGFAPPGMVNNETGETMNMQTAQISTESALSAYAQNSGNDHITQLIELLQSQNSGEALSSLDVNA